MAGSGRSVESRSNGLRWTNWRGAGGAVPFGDDVIAIVERHTSLASPWARHFEACSKTLLSKLDLVFLDPLDPAIRKIGAPIVGGSAECGA